MIYIDITQATPAGTEAAARETARVLSEGGTAVFPTETVYGIGCLMSRPDAAERIYGIKRRDRSKPLPVMVDSPGRIGLAAESHPALEVLAREYMPGPLTVILPKKPSVPDIVCAGGDTVALRIPDHPFLLTLLRILGEPICATSANLSGRPAPSSFDLLDPEIRKAADIVINMGPAEIGSASVILDLTGREPRILREGTISREALIRTLQRIQS
ncbi:MAG: threonylcarbamoyl-AMP synthase [Abditibacteriota bacterium]|nr:threonylcarbamoyl-AMP synthase [Abditibacteriota bacterium]